MKINTVYVLFRKSCEFLRMQYTQQRTPKNLIQISFRRSTFIAAFDLLFEKLVAGARVELATFVS